MALLKEDIKQIIKVASKSDDFEFISYENSNLKEHATGFLSDQCKKWIKYKAKGKVEDIYVFIKELPKSEYHRANMLEMGGFQRETLVFEILADFEDYEIPIPKCYLAKENYTLVLEDISLRGYENKNLYETLDVTHCEKVMESLAKFHAASFIIERRKKFKINEKYPIIETEVLLNGNKSHSGNKCSMAGIKALREVARKYLPQYPSKVTEKSFNYMENVFDKLRSSKVFPNALSHSDMWLNNIMFKYDESQRLENAFLIDFQLTTYKPPAFDIQFFFHNCTTKQFRKDHYTPLTRHYFQALSEQLARSGIDLNDIMSWEDLQRMQEVTLPVVLGKIPIYVPFVLMPPGLLKDVTESDEKFKKYFEEDRTKYVLQAMKEHEHYNKRTLECLTELFDYFASH